MNYYIFLLLLFAVSSLVVFIFDDMVDYVRIRTLCTGFAVLTGAVWGLLCYV